MATTVRITATRAAATYTASIAAGSVGNFKANGLAINDKVVIKGKTGTLAGAHDGANNAATLTDSGEAWGINQFLGYTLTNTTDGSSTTVTSNTATTITGVLSGGTDDDWDIGDAYTLTGFNILTFVNSGGKEGQTVMEYNDNTKQLAGPIDFEISKESTVNAVEVVQYT